jgi:hypothetical protein
MSTKPRTVLESPREEEQARKHLVNLAYDGNPPKISRTPVFLTLDEAISELSGATTSKAMRDKARRTILKALKEGKLRLGGVGVRSLARKTKRAKQLDLKAKARSKALRIWDENRKASVKAVARKICDEERFGSASSVVEKWIANLHPRNFR